MSKFIFFTSLYAYFSFLNLVTKLKITPAWFDGKLLRNHQQLLDFQYTNNEQSRLLQFYIPEILSSTFGISIIESYIFQRWFFVFLSFLCFHYFLLKWFCHLRAFASVTLLSMIMSFTFFNHLQESAPLLMLTFIMGLWFIRDKKIKEFSFIMLIGVMNNETMLVLSALWFLYSLDSFKVKENLYLVCNTILISLPASIALFAIRYINKDRPHLGDPYMFSKNIQNIILDAQKSPFEWYNAFYLNIFFVFGFMWIFLFKNFKNKPLFFKRCLLFLPVFIVPHFLTGVIYEVRQMLPIAYIVIPMTLFLI